MEKKIGVPKKMEKKTQARTPNIVIYGRFSENEVSFSIREDPKNKLIPKI